MKPQFIFILKCVLATALLWIGAKTQLIIPATNIPLTLQTLVLCTVLLLDKKVALWAVCFYLLLGGLGLPVFSKDTAGWSYFVGPTAGFLFGFLFVAIINLSIKTHGHLLGLINWAILIHLIILSSGAVGLKVLADMVLPFSKWTALGVGALIKSVAAALIVFSWNQIKQSQKSVKA